MWVDSRGVRPTPVSLWTFLAQVTGAGRPVFAPGEQVRRWQGLRTLGEVWKCHPRAQASMALCCSGS